MMLLLEIVYALVIISFVILFLMLVGFLCTKLLCDIKDEINKRKNWKNIKWVVS